MLSNQLILCKIINKELKQKDVTLFPIPFPPISLSQAYAFGDSYRKEIAIQVAISNIVRKIRENRLTPKAIISGDNGILKLTVKSIEPSDFSEISLWHLNQFDNLKNILEKITSLLQDMQIEWRYSN